MNLTNYVEACLRGTSFEDNTEVTQIIRQVNPTLNQSYTLVISEEEPYDRVLPLNVIWLCMNKTEAQYRKLLTRESKESSARFQHTWVPITDIAQVWETQIYDPNDLGSVEIEHATTTTHGTARLTTRAAFESAPRFVSTEDPRNTDARKPTFHTHPERPATVLQHAKGTLRIDANMNPADGDGTMLVGVSQREVKNSKLKLTDITGE